jgi:hypothetical protein
MLLLLLVVWLLCLVLVCVCVVNHQEECAMYPHWRVGWVSFLCAGRRIPSIADGACGAGKGCTHFVITIVIYVSVNVTVVLAVYAVGLSRGSGSW